jgi:hypothetical protein
VHLETPWGSAGSPPTLPFRSSGPIDAGPAAEGRATGRALVLATPWTGADVRLPTRATTHPGMVSRIVPDPRRTPESVDTEPVDTEPLGTAAMPRTLA